jgi:hypothetical protein
MTDVLALITQPRQEVRLATVLDVAPGGVATVEMRGGTITAQLWDQAANAVVGDTVALLPIGDTWVAIAIKAFNRSGISVTAAGVSTVTGSLVVKDATKPTAPMTMVGNMSVPQESVGNDALLNLITPEVVNASASSFEVSIVGDNIIGVDLIVPDGLTRLLLNAAGYMSILPSASSLTTLQITLAAVNGSGCSAYLTSGNHGSLSAGLATLAVDLTPGSTLRLSAYASSSPVSQSVSGYNLASLTASLLWLR